MYCSIHCTPVSPWHRDCIPISQSDIGLSFTGHAPPSLPARRLGRGLSGSFLINIVSSPWDGRPLECGYHAVGLASLEYQLCFQ